MDKLIAAGSRPANDRLDFVAQLATNEQALVSAQNQIDISYLNLKQLLELDPELPFKIIKPEINIPLNNDVEGLTLRAVFNQAYSRQPQIRAGELRLKSASLDADIAKSDWLPTLSIFGNISSNYSTASPKNILKNNAVPSGSSIQTVPFISHINGAKVTAGIERPTYTSDQYKNYTYFNQISDNFGQALGLTLQIPIYDRGITRIAVERAKIGLINQQLSNQRTQQVLKSDIQAALANARAAKKQLEASDKTFTAVKGAYENIDKKYKVGAATTFEMTTARNNMDTAERNLIISRFDYIFKLKIVDFYQGKKITLD
jgi:outer membrane protein